jgi:hypothetical protein
MNNLVRIVGRNGTVYEERMSEAQMARFLRLVNAPERDPLGVAFGEWSIQVVEPASQHEAEGLAGAPPPSAGTPLEHRFRDHTPGLQ